MTVTVDGIPIVSVGDPTASTAGVSLTSYLYVGGIPDSDAEVGNFITVNGLSSSLRVSKSIFQLLIFLYFRLSQDLH